MWLRAFKHSLHGTTRTPSGRSTPTDYGPILILFFKFCARAFRYQSQMQCSGLSSVFRRIAHSLYGLACMQLPSLPSCDFVAFVSVVSDLSPLVVARSGPAS